MYLPPLPVRGFLFINILSCQNPWMLTNIFVYLQRSINISGEVGSSATQGRAFFMLVNIAEKR